MIQAEIPESYQAMPWVVFLVRLAQKQAEIIQQQSEQIIKLKEVVQELRDEITRLKKTPKRPKFRPNGTSSKGKKGKRKSPNDSKGSNDSPKAPVEKVKEAIVVKPPNIPKGSRFKGYANYSIQELMVTPKEVTYKLEIWETPNGSILRGSLPTEVKGSHFGVDLRSMIHGLYASGMTEPAIFRFISNMGIEISETHIHNILMKEAQEFKNHNEEILSAGLKEAPYIRVDDTGAKHCHQNHYCTHIGSEYFAYYKTTPTKSRMNFLKILAQGQKGYIINEAFIYHLFQSKIEDYILNAFEAHKGKRYQTTKGLNRLLNRMGLKNKRVRNACLEAGLVGLIQETQLKEGQLLISDRARQFAILDHAACWVHMERPLRKLIATTEAIETEIKQVREAIWSLYAQVKEASLTQSGKEKAIEAYDQLVTMEVLSPGVAKVLNDFKEYREEMLKALDHPGLPLHNNDSERDIRGMVKFRNISGSTKSSEGRAFRDGLMTLMQTCYRLGESFWGFLRAWVKGEPVNLAACIRRRYQAAAPP